jgi:hypothetical protein
MVSIPIPDPDSPRTYADYSTPAGGTYSDLLNLLGVSSLRCAKTRVPVVPPPGVHFDPDLIAGSRSRERHWRGLFGQAKAAQGHLANQHVGIGDLFLFFGWFRRTKRRGNGLRFVGPSAHVVWGWLEVGAVIAVDRDRPERWMLEHPHLSHRAKYSGANNTIYIAAQHSTWLPGFAGSGVATSYHDRLRLTADGEERRRVWRLPEEFHRPPHATLSGQSEKAWTRSDAGWLLRSACIGQEFVIPANDGIRAWVQTILSADSDDR